MHKIAPRLTGVVLFVSLALAACSGSSAPTLPPAPPSAQDVTITLATNPDPPASGQVELTVTLTGAAGQPIDDASVNLLASHSTMTGMDTQQAAN